MKTLIISVDYPWPENKGNRMRTMHFVRFFMERGEVDLMCYKSHAPSEPSESMFRKEHYIEFDPIDSAENKGILTVLRDKFVECKPWIVNSFGGNTVNYIQAIIMEEDYDVILCRYAVNAYPLLSLPDKYKQRVILDLDDIMSDCLYDAINGEKFGFELLKTYFDKMVYRRYQIKCLELGKIILCSEADRAIMAKYIKTPKMHVVPNIAPKQEIPIDYAKNGHGNKFLLFVGVLSYQPNEMGIIWFIKEIFNKLPLEFQDIGLLVVGKDPSDKLVTVCGQNGKIDLIRNPPDVMPFFEKCFAVVVPVLTGGGTRIKILEAGNCFRPVISTPLGAYGLGLVEYDDVLYFEDYRSFVDKMNWLQEEENHNKLTKKLNEVVKSSYSEDNFQHNVSKLLQL